MLKLTEIHGTDFSYSLVGNNNDKSQKFIKTVESNQYKKLPLSELAFLCNMSLSTFKLEFKKSIPNHR